MKTIIDDIVKLVANGWRPYRGHVENRVYAEVSCPHAPLSDDAKAAGAKRGKAVPSWFCRADIFLCLGCGRRCSLNRPKGFQAPLPIKYPNSQKTPYTLTPQEMVTKLRLLTVNQAAYCLNASQGQIYNWIAEGRLRRLKERPVRIPVEDVREEMERIAE